MQHQSIATKRLILKIYTIQEVHDVFANNAKAEIMAEMGYPNDAKYLKELKRFESGLLVGKRPTMLFQMILKDTNKIIGACGFHNWFEEHYRAEIGYEIFYDQYKQQGFMHETLQAVLDFGFSKLNLNRIEACIYKDNIASLALAKKNQFVFEGNLRGHYFMDDTFKVFMLFSLLKKEWKNKKIK